MDDKIRQLNNQIELLKKSSMGADEMRVDYFLEPGTHQWHCPADCEEVVLTMAAGGCNYSYAGNSNHLEQSNMMVIMNGGYVFKKRIQIPQNLRNTDIPIQVGKAFWYNRTFFNDGPYPDNTHNTQFKHHYLCSEFNNIEYVTLYFFNNVIKSHISKINSSFGNLVTCTGAYYYKSDNTATNSIGQNIEGIPNGKKYYMNISSTSTSNSSTVIFTKLVTNIYNPLSGWTHNGASIPIYCGNGAIGFFSENIPNNAIIPSRISKTFKISETQFNPTIVANGTYAGVVSTGSPRIGTVFDAQPGCVIVEYK